MANKKGAKVAIEELRRLMVGWRDLAAFYNPGPGTWAEITDRARGFVYRDCAHSLAEVIKKIEAAEREIPTDEQ